jgi:glutathione S-transferase
MMKLYFSPLACSLASRITAHEANLAIEFVEVDLANKRTHDGAHYLHIHALGLVPALRLEDGELLSENPAVLQYLADLAPHTGLAPAPGDLARSRLHQWLSFVGTELHKALWTPLLERHAPQEVKEYALARSESRLGHVAAWLGERPYLLGTFSVADAYLFTVLNWAQATPIQLSRWPALVSYMSRVRARPAVKRALAEEAPLYMREQARLAAQPAPA